MVKRNVYFHSWLRHWRKYIFSLTTREIEYDLPPKLTNILFFLIVVLLIWLLLVMFTVVVVVHTVDNVVFAAVVVVVANIEYSEV